MSETRKSAATGDGTEGWTDEERAAMKERAREVTSTRRRSSGGKAYGESEVLAKIAEMSETDRIMAERIHAVVRASAPDLVPRLWYGQPAYARDSKIVCFFQPADKFKSRYATLGFNDEANLDDGTMWPTAFALTMITADDENRIAALVTQAVS